MAGAFFQQYSKLSSPIPLANLKLWLDGDNHLNTNSRWYDKSVNNYIISQSIAVNQPTLTSNALNGHSGYSFDGNDYLSGGKILNLNTHGYSLFVVYKRTAGTNVNIIGKTAFAGVSGEYSLSSLGTSDFSSYCNTTGTQHAIGTQNTSTFGIANIIMKRIAPMDFSNKLYWNNTIKADYTAAIPVNDVSNNYNFNIGATNQPAYYFTGIICEIIYYDIHLDNTNRDIIYNYLKNKYGL